jgi:D-aminopeptidase
MTGEARPRLRELGIVVGNGEPGVLNAITDVPDVRVGHFTRRDGSEPGPDGRGPFNTGITVVLAHGGDLYGERVLAGVAVLNGSGELAGREFVDEMGVLDAPIALTGSFNVARVVDALITDATRRRPEIGRAESYVHPLVAECSDSYLSDLVARPMGEDETLAALESARTGPVAEGAVGAGTGLISFGYKAGIGTASRLARAAGEAYTVGALVSTNTGRREQLLLRGVPVGRFLSDGARDAPQGSIIMVVATDAPLLARQLSRLARRAHLGLARTGATAWNGSGDFSVAFSTGNRYELGEPLHRLREIADGEISPLFDAAVESIEEAVLNALCAAGDFVGRGGASVAGLPLDDVRRLVAGAP